MTKELLNQLKDFEIFVERMEKFIIQIKSDEKFINLDPNFKNYDLRDKDGDVFELPCTIEDYFSLWQDVLIAYKRFQNEKDSKLRDAKGYNYFFFDLYWNDVRDKYPSAYYQDEFFVVNFDDEKGIYYK